MILGVDHLALGADSFNKNKASLTNLGYECEFEEIDIKNPRAKRDLLRSYSPRHSLAYFRHPNGFAIELIDHEHICDNSIGFFSVELNNPQEITLWTSDLESESTFWTTYLGFKASKSSENTVVLELNSPIKQWSCKLLLKYKKQEQCFLDSSGFPCLAMLTSNLSTLRKNLAALDNIQVSEPFDLTINNKQLEIFMFRSPTGAFGEIIQIKSGNNF